MRSLKPVLVDNQLQLEGCSSRGCPEDDIAVGVMAIVEVPDGVTMDCCGTAALLSVVMEIACAGAWLGFSVGGTANGDTRTSFKAPELAN